MIIPKITELCGPFHALVDQYRAFACWELVVALAFAATMSDLSVSDQFDFGRKLSKQF